MADQSPYYTFVTSTHDLYRRYRDAWNLAVKSYWGGVEYKAGKYLKQYTIDSSTPSDVITTYQVDEDGNETGAYSSYVASGSRIQAETGYTENDFYSEKLNQVATFPYTRLYAQEYNALLWRTPPVRTLPETPDVEMFVQDVDGEGSSINEFMSMVDTYTTVFGVVWVSCIKYGDSPYAKWKMHFPTDVRNWKYSYTESGDLQLKEIVIRVANETDVEIYQYLTNDFIDTIFIPKEDVEDTEIDLPDSAMFVDDGEKGFYRIRQDNPMGEVFVRPIYQSTKIYNGVGHTPIFDIAQIQKSIYSDMGEIYSAVSYGSHPVNLIDTDTANLNDGAISAEPGAVIRVNQSLNGQPQHVFEFVAPPLDSIKELRELIDQKIDKMNQVAMIRSDELIKASRSGAQIEQYDSKLEAFIRKKATSLENAEYQLWKLWFDWQEQPVPGDLSVSYNRLYSQKGLEQEISEINRLMELVDLYQTRYMTGTTPFVAEVYDSAEQAAARAQQLGGSGFHMHETLDGTIEYMPFSTHAEYEKRLEDQNPGVDYEEDTGFEKEVKEKLRTRLKQLIEGSSTNNSL